MKYPHSAGPWRVENGWIVDKYNRIIGDSYSFKSMSEDGQMIDTYDAHGVVNIAAVESDQNRQLMAAAPELLEAVQMVLEAGSEDGEPVSDSMIVDAIDWKMLRDAIEKAKGGQ